MNNSILQQVIDSMCESIKQPFFERDYFTPEEVTARLDELEERLTEEVNKGNLLSYKLDRETGNLWYVPVMPLDKIKVTLQLNKDRRTHNDNAKRHQI